jgi:hypothetical protein
MIEARAASITCQHDPSDSDGKEILNTRCEQHFSTGYKGLSAERSELKGV